MIKFLITINILINIIVITWVWLFSSNEETDLKVKNYQLKCQNLILEREYEKLRDFIDDIRNEEVKIDWSNDKYIVVYEPKTDDFKRFFTDLRCEQDDLWFNYIMLTVYINDIALMY